MKKLISVLSLFSICSSSLSTTISCNVQPKSTMIPVKLIDDDVNSDQFKNIDKYRTAETPLPILAREILEVLTYTNDKYTNKDTYEKDFIKMVGNDALNNWSFESINDKNKIISNVDDWKEFFYEFSSSDNVDNAFTSFTFDVTKNNTVYGTDNKGTGLNFYTIKDKNVKEPKNKGNFDENECKEPISWDVVDPGSSKDKYNEIVSSFKSINIIGEKHLSEKKLSSVDSKQNPQKNLPLDGDEIKVLTTTENGNTNIDSDALYYRSVSINFSIDFKSIHTKKTYTLNFKVNNLLELFTANVVENYLIFTPYKYSFKKTTSDFKTDINLFENFEVSNIDLKTDTL